MPDSYDSFSVPIVVVVLEGPSDKKYLKQPLEAYFREKYNKTCRLVAVTDLTGNPEISEEEFFPQLRKSIEIGLSSKENMINEDVAVMITEVVHIFDIDEAYIDNNHIIENTDKDEFFYTREGIQYCKKSDVEKRNKRKQKRIEFLLGQPEIMLFDKTFPYNKYFYSVNIDDFHYDDALNLDKDTKNKKAAEYERKYLVKKSPQGKLKLFLKIFEKTNPKDFPKTLSETWEYISRDNNSLKKCSNVFLIVSK